MHKLKGCLKNKAREGKKTGKGLKRQTKQDWDIQKKEEGTTPSAHLRVSQHSPSVLLSALYPSFVV